MLIEVIIFTLLGIIFGTFAGLIPGIHPNLLGAIVVAISVSFLSSIDPIYLAVFITSMAISNTFISFIPSVFLGAPEDGTELSVLPGHELLKKGQGYEAIVLTAYGGLAAIFLLMLIILPSFLVVEDVHNFLLGEISLPLMSSVSIMAILLIIVSSVLIMSEKSKVPAFFTFIITGILGTIVLGIGFGNSTFFPGLGVKEPLLPLLTGLFGASTLIISIRAKTKIPRQKITKPKINKDIIPPIIGAFITSPLSSLLPGLGSGQAAVIGSIISKVDRRGFLVLLGATNTIVVGFSFITLYLISRTRTGAAVAINNLIGVFSVKVLILIIVVMLISGIISYFVTINMAEFFSKKIPELSYMKVSIVILIFLFLVVFMISGLMGTLVLIVSTFTGIYCISLGARRTHMMGCLLIPVIFFYLFYV